MSKTKIVFFGGSKGGVGKSTTSHLACASAKAQARPNPRLDAHTMALRPAIPRSIRSSLAPVVALGWPGQIRKAAHKA